MLVKKPPVEIAGNLWMLGTTEYPFFLYKGPDRGTIFEGGIGPTGSILRDQLQQLEIDCDYIQQLVITHAHPDHVMAVPFIREICSGVEVSASEPAAGMLAADKAVSFFCKMDDMLAESLTSAGVINQDQRRTALAENRIAVDRTLKDGDEIDVGGGASFRVLETPGHSDCSLSFFEPQEKILIISDATGYYMPEHDFWWPNYFTDYGAYLSSIERLAQLGAKVLCLSHNSVLLGADDIAAYFQVAIAVTKGYHEHICDEVNSGKSVRDVAERLGAQIHQKSPLMPLDFFQKNCALLVKNSLRHEGITAS
jgi:glyoxylase-like metal-dependent hydrolase (beta-lactamase superfamily II)